MPRLSCLLCERCIALPLIAVGRDNYADMDLGIAVALVTFLPAAKAFTSTTSSSSDGFIEAGTTPTCPANLFDKALVAATCHQDWDRNGRWFMRLISSGIPAHSYGQAEVPWHHLVKDQQWDFTIPLNADEDEVDAQAALLRDVDPSDFLTDAAREDRPIGIALNGVPFFSPLTATGADTVNPLPGKVAENDTIFDDCAGSLQVETGAYGYRVMPPCLYTDSSPSALEDGVFTPANVLRGFKVDSTDEPPETPLDSPLLGFAMDGRRLYGPYDSTNSLASGLDVCNGRWEKQVDDDGGDADDDESDGSEERYAYFYRATPSFPYLIGCWGPAGAPLDAALAATTTTTAGVASATLSASGDFFFTEIEGGFLVEVAENGCPAGSFLSIDSGECEACQAGTYGKDAGLTGLECPGLCPPGYYCPDGTTSPTSRCPAGTFGASPGLGDESCSGECQPGFFCLSGSVVPDPNECGSILYYCPKGSGQRSPVANGYFTTPVLSPDTVAARRVRSGQEQCEPGTYCTGGRRRPCPSGTFGTEPGLTSADCSSPCPAGSFCPEGSVDPIPCPAGSYGGEEGLSNEECSGLCAMGHYCPAGSASAFQYSCPAGRFGGERGLTDGLCAEEHACSRTADTPCLASLCDPGYFCPPGSSSAQAHPCGSGEHYCPQGSAFPTPADVGHYTYVEGATDGGLGDAWSLTGQTVRTAQAECEPGYYCEDGARLPCPAGTVGSSPGLSSSSCSGLCPAGYYCGVAEPLLGERCADPRWYCPEGSSSRSEVGVGNFTLAGPPDRRVAQAICPAGSYCQAGVSFPCPPGTYGEGNGLSSPACSGPCPAGRYCPSGTSSALTSSSDNETTQAGADEVGLACPAGRYGVQGMGDPACTGPCQPGYYCPEGSTSAREEECGSGSLFCPSGSSSPTEVALGWFATGGDGESTRSGQVECVAATGEGGATPPSGMSIIERCPDNTVGWNGTTTY